ncbi:hypothetical protein RBU49_00700 [Clostridium sp. MB40-C1]|uniref:DUF6762 family protein n=1 Tax=Clostridium sp. MB40-C1 TaxID=3070996 RepID=UPI0027E11D43|nr:DUF6762 family protein [Clostridium sp. MB40-C1]WMJ80796.1 hypothetical protein RBU49_00700 [Clostridium sp. MB40-C1]
MEFSSLVLMEVDKDNKFIREIGSYEVGEGAEYITKFFCKEEKINLYFDTGRDVEEWEYSAIYDLFDLQAFEEKGYKIKEKDDEYNPTWVVEFDYIEEHVEMVEKLREICNIIHLEVKKSFQESENKKEEYV